MKLRGIILLFSLALSLTNCDNDGNNQCKDKQTAYVTSVNSPNSGSVNENIDIEVKFRPDTGCGKFGSFIETRNGNTRTIEVEANYIGCICPDIAPVLTTNYNFIASNAGNYVLNFKSSPTEYITVNLTIN